MSKYEPLETFLTDRLEAEVPMEFSDIEALIGAPLPPAAFKHRAWWSNNPSNSAITSAWLRAGFKTERVDMDSRKLVFRRAAAAGPRQPQTRRGPPGGVIAQLREALRGTARISGDLTAPTGARWDAEG